MKSFGLKNKIMKSCFAFQKFPKTTSFVGTKFGKREYVSQKLESKIPEIRSSTLDTGCFADNKLSFSFPLKNWKQEDVGEVQLRENIFKRVPIRTDILHRVVVWQLAKRRQGTRKTKTRAEVSGGGRKPWAQKKTGRARVGSIRNPIWRHGGHTHAKKPRDFSYSLPRKIRALGLANALTVKLQQGNLFVLDSFDLEKPKTKILLDKINNFSGETFLLIGPETLSQDLKRASSALKNMDVLAAKGFNVYDILRRQVLIIHKEALDLLQSRLKF